MRLPVDVATRARKEAKCQRADMRGYHDFRLFPSTSIGRCHHAGHTRRDAYCHGNGFARLREAARYLRPGFYHDM